MYKAGDKIIYASVGVATVERIETEGGRLMMTITPDGGAYTIKVPAESDKVYMRPVMTRVEAEALIDSLPEVEPRDLADGTANRLAEQYEALLKSHDRRDLVELTKIAYRKKLQKESQHRKLGAVDARFMKRGEDLLFGELAAALGIEREEVLPYITARLGNRE